MFNKITIDNNKIKNLIKSTMPFKLLNKIRFKWYTTIFYQLNNILDI